MASDIWVATEAAQINVGGQEIALTPGVTTVRAGHPMLAQHPDWFKPFYPTYEWEAPEPGAPRSAARPDQRGARTR